MSDSLRGSSLVIGHIKITLTEEIKSQVMHMQTGVIGCIVRYFSWTMDTKMLQLRSDLQQIKHNQIGSIDYCNELVLIGDIVRDRETGGIW